MVDTWPPVQDAEHIRPGIFARMSTDYARFGPLQVPTPSIFFADFPAGTVVTTPGDHVRLLLAYRGDGTLVRGGSPLRMRVPHSIEGQPLDIGAVGIHDIDLAVVPPLRRIP